MPVRLGLRVVIDGAHVGQQRMRGRQPHTGFQARARGRGVDRMQAAQLRRTFDQRQRRVGIRQAPENGVERQLRQE